MDKGRENKPHIGIFGRRNAGKSSLINALAGQEIAIVSPVAGTTTDPVNKTIELQDIGPVIFIDTAGIDDSGEVGSKRVAKTRQVIPIIDMALLIITGSEAGDFERALIDEFKTQEIPCLIVHTKNDLHELSVESLSLLKKETGFDCISISALKNSGIDLLIKEIRRLLPESAYRKPTLLGDLVKQGDIVLLITPIDIEAPEGRLILPQVQAIRDILDNDCIAVVVKERETEAFLKNTKIRPALVVCDTSVILKSDAMIPKDIPLTGFSILLARFKGHFGVYLQGTPMISKLKENDRILILESCTHHVSCDDIGRVKIPRWINQFTGKTLQYIGTSPEERLVFFPIATIGLICKTMECKK